MRNIAVLAGNAHIRCDASNQFAIDHQPFALEAAFQFVRHFRHRIAHIGIAVDHRGSFARQFLHHDYTDASSPKKLTSKQRKHISVHHLHEKIFGIFRPYLEKYDIEPDAVRIFPEEMDRSSLRTFAANPKDRRIFLSPVDARHCACDEASACEVPSEKEQVERYRPNCDGLTAELIRRIASQKGVQLVRTFWQQTEKTVRPAIISRGTELAYSVFHASDNVRATVLQTMLRPYRLPGDLHSRIVSTQCMFVPGNPAVQVLPQGHIYFENKQEPEGEFPQMISLPQWDRVMKETEVLS